MNPDDTSKMVQVRQLLADLTADMDEADAMAWRMTALAMCLATELALSFSPSTHDDVLADFSIFAKDAAANLRDGFIRRMAN